MNKPFDFSNCPFWGQGGRYIADPVTGVRTRVVDEPAPATAPAPAAGAPTPVATQPTQVAPAAPQVQTVPVKTVQE